jgi:hypothetical protein
MDTMITRLLGALARREQETGTRISDADLARAAKINQAAVKYWRDNPTTHLKAENVFLLADFLTVAPRWLATGEGHPDRVGIFPDANVTDKKLLGEITTLIIRLEMIRDEVEKVVMQAKGFPDMLAPVEHSHDMNIASIRHDLEATKELVRGVQQEDQKHEQHSRSKKPSSGRGKN